jgi:hypothetical protein
MDYALTKLKEISVSDLPETGSIFTLDFDIPEPTMTVGNQELGDRPIYNAITDGKIVPDYANQIDAGTDQRRTVVDWIQPGLKEGKERFFFPPGHYQIGEGVGNDSTVVDINGYNSIEIFGIKGKTFFHSKQWTDLKFKNNPLFRFGSKEDTQYCKLHGITFINDNHVTNSEQSEKDNNLKWGWCYLKKYNPQEKVKRGDFRVSLADDFVIEFLKDGRAVDVTSRIVHPLLNWGPNATYLKGSFAKFITAKNLYKDKRCIARCMLGGISGTNEPLLSRPSNDGAKGSNFWNWVALSSYSKHIEIYDCEFVGCAGFSEAGGSAIGITGREHYISHNIFRDFQYGTSLGGFFHYCKIRHNIFYKCGGWGFQYGTFNAHGVYCQGGNNLFAFNRFESHYYGLDIKIHGNVRNSDCWNNQFIGNIHDNYGWTAIELVKSSAYEDSDDSSDFIDEEQSGTYHSAILCKQAIVEGCHFRIRRSVWNAWNDWGDKPGAGQAIKTSTLGMVVTNCTFTDTHGITTGDYPIMNYKKFYPSIMVSNCSFQHIFRKCSPFIGESIHAENCEIDFRAVNFSKGSGVKIGSFSKLTNSRIYAHGATEGERNEGLLVVYGPHTSLNEVTVTLDKSGTVFNIIGGNNQATSGDYVSIKNCKFIAPEGKLIWYPESYNKYWEFENNLWAVFGNWGQSRFNHDNFLTWRWKNEKGNFWHSGSSVAEDHVLMDFDNGEVKLIKSGINREFSTLRLVDIFGQHTNINVYGISLWNNDHKDSSGQYRKAVAISEKSLQWIKYEGSMSEGDWVIGKPNGKVITNGITGSTVRPASGFIGFVREVKNNDTAQIEIIQWK